MQKPTPENPYSTKYDLTNCDKEPIHLIQTCQSFAGVIAVDISDWIIVQTSSNISDFVGESHEKILNKPLSDLFSGYIMEQLKLGVEQKDFSEINPLTLPVDSNFDQKRTIDAAEQDGLLILTLEHSPAIENEFSFLNKLDLAIQKIQKGQPIEELFQTIASEVKTITNYDRVMIYKFDSDFNGEVIAEVKESNLEPFLNIRYPATDIPKQARELFLINRVRMLVDVDDELAMIQPSLNPRTGEPLDVGNCAARGSSPIHLEYLRNMGVTASLTVAIVEDGKLWGLIACHHYSGRKVLSYRTRNLIRFVGQVISGHLSLERATNFRERLLKKNIIHARLFEQMNDRKDVIIGLTNGGEYTVMDFINCCGSSIFLGDHIESIGKTPQVDEIEQVIDFLDKQNVSTIFSTNNLSNVLPDSPSFASHFAGVLSVQISSQPNEYIIWWREAEAQQVIWGGNPDKAVLKTNENGRLTPRKSFEKWKEVIKDQALPWAKHESDSAIVLRNDIKEIILKRFKKLKKLHADLQASYKELETFSYTVSHDLRSPLRAIEGFSQILLEDYADKLDDYGMEVVNTIILSIDKMNSFVNDILKLSKLAKTKLIYNDIEVKSMVEKMIPIVKNNNSEYQKVKVSIADDLPNVSGDKTLIQQLFLNLIGNAIKYTSKSENPQVEISGKQKGKMVHFSIKDNGIGFDEQYKDKIFQVFSRLVNEDDYEGSGVGLSIVMRVIERHQGEIEVKSQLGEGTTFKISFPKKIPEQFE